MTEKGGNNQHHRRNGTWRNAGMKRAAGTTTTVKSTSILPNSPPFLMATETDASSSHKTMITVQTSLNGNIFMHCPVDMAEDFQVSWQCRELDYHIIMDDKHTHMSIRHSIIGFSFVFLFVHCGTRFGTISWNEMWLNQLTANIAAVNRVE